MSSAQPLPADPLLDRLVEILREMGSVLVCYSGGVDSAFVLAVAHRVLGDNCIGMTAVSPSLADFEREEAITLAKQIGGRHELVASNEIEDEDYAKNNVDRCFHCKSELYRVSEKKQAEWGMAFSVNGTNLDDLGDYRPGLEAAKQAGARSPLVEAGFTKADVRRIAQLLGLPVWDKPAAACLSSRLPYGTRVTRDSPHADRLARSEDPRARHSSGARTLACARRRRGNARVVDGPRRDREGRDGSRLRRARRDRRRRQGARLRVCDIGSRGLPTGSHNEVLSRRSLPVVS